MSITRMGSHLGQGGRWELRCDECDVFVAVVGFDELVAVKADGGVLCFDCEGVNSQVVPPHLLPGRNELLVLTSARGAVVAWCEHPARPTFAIFEQVRMPQNRKGEGGSSCLSIEPKLNTNER